MSNISVSGLTWGQRFAIIDHYNPSDDQIVNGLQISHEELNSARGLRDSGRIQAASDIDVSKYEGIFIAPMRSPTTEVAIKPSTELASIPEPSSEPPQTATNPAAVPQQRGRKGSKIKNAFEKIPEEPICIKTFATENNVSINVLKQSSRFDPIKEKGRVRTKTDSELGKLVIWREKSENSAQNSTETAE